MPAYKSAEATDWAREVFDIFVGLDADEEITLDEFGLGESAPEMVENAADAGGWLVDDETLLVTARDGRQFLVTVQEVG
jgi:hypothetical protein